VYTNFELRLPFSKIKDSRKYQNELKSQYHKNYNQQTFCAVMTSLAAYLGTAGLGINLRYLAHCCSF